MSPFLTRSFVCFILLLLTTIVLTAFAGSRECPSHQTALSFTNPPLATPIAHPPAFITTNTSKNLSLSLEVYQYFSRNGSELSSISQHSLSAAKSSMNIISLSPLNDFSASASILNENQHHPSSHLKLRIVKNQHDHIHQSATSSFKLSKVRFKGARRVTDQFITDYSVIYWNGGGSTRSNNMSTFSQTHTMSNSFVFDHSFSETLANLPTLWTQDSLEIVLKLEMFTNAYNGWTRVAGGRTETSWVTVKQIELEFDYADKEEEGKER